MASDLFHPFLLGGGETRMYETARRLAKRHEIHIITRRFNGSSSHEVHEGVHIHRVFVPSAGVRLESAFDGSTFMVGALLKGLSVGSFDLIAPQQFFPILPCWVIAKARRRPIVATIHDVYRETWLQKYGLKGSLMSVFESMMLKLPYTKVITVSDSSKKKLIESGVPGSKIDVIPNGVDLEKYDKIKIKKSDKPRVIYVGRLIGYKHVDDLLVAFSKLDFDAELYIIGEGPEIKNLKALAEKLGISAKVTFTGFVSEPRKIQLLKSSHVLVLPSSTEGFGIVVVEAWAARVAMLASDIPALRELVEDGKNGLVFKLRDTVELSGKLEQVLKNERFRSKLSAEGYARVKEKFSWDKVAIELERSFQN